VIEPVHGPTAGVRPGSDPGVRPGSDPGFGAALAKELGRLTYSGHALDRIRQRGIAVDEARLGAGVDRAAAKGARTTLVLIDQAAFVVAPQNRTVITAVDREHMREQVFTNIDSAVIA
jgi:flagellar operon protein